MAFKSSDGWLWASLVILGYLGSLAVHRQLVAIRQASEVTRHDKRPNISQQTEDALKLKALDELTQSPDQNIRAASVKIITDRAIREGPAWDMMIRDITGTDIARRDKALTCLRFLCPSFGRNKQTETVICRHSTYKAIVDCLCNLLPEARIAQKNPTLRTQSEQDALYILHHILCFDVAKALEAGVISRWLVQYPFGGAGVSEHRKREVILNLLDNETFDEDGEFGQTMRVMLSCMSNTSLYRKEMVEHGLLDVSKGNDITVDGDWDMPLYSQHTQFNRMGRRLPIGISNRPREESFEEQALRRRRREAMVLGEIGRPIERADIIERDSAAVDGFRSQAMASLGDEPEEESEQSLAAIADEDVNEEFELLIEEITQAGPTSDVSWWSWLTRLRPDGLAREPVRDR